MNRRHMLAGAAVLPAAALPLTGLAAPVNGTEAAWRTLIAAQAEHAAKVLALDDAWAARLPDGVPDVTAELPELNGCAARQVTLGELRKARGLDLMIHPMSEDMETIFREMLEKEMAMRPQRTPEAVTERTALYDRLEAELTAQEAVARPVKPAHIARLESEVDVAYERAGAADDALLAAPVLTIEDAARKLQHALDRHMDPEDWNGKLVASALEGLRRLTGAA